MPTPDPDDAPIAPAQASPVIHVPEHLRQRPLVADAPHPVSLTHPKTPPESLPAAGAAPSADAPVREVLSEEPPHGEPSAFVKGMSELNAEGRGDMTLREAVQQLHDKGVEIPANMAHLLK